MTSAVWSHQVKPGGKTRIAINGRFLTRSITGVERYSREITSAIDALVATRPDVEITLFTPPLGTAPPTLQNIRVVQAGNMRGHAWEQLELPVLSRGQTLFCPGNTAPLASIYSQQPVVACVHDLSYRYFGEAYRWKFRAAYSVIVPTVLERANAVITVSESERRAILSSYPRLAPRLVSIQNGGLPAGSVPPFRPRKSEPPSVLYVGSLSKRKNIHTIVEVAVRLARSKGVRFVAVGGAADGFTSFNWQVPSDVAHLIEFVGQLDDTKALLDYYCNASCFLFPSLYESSPLPPIEAMSCGCPVVASSIPSLVERCGDAALYCDPHDIDDVERKVSRVLNEPALATELRQAGFDRADTFNWMQAAAHTLAIIEGAAAGARTFHVEAPHIERPIVRRRENFR
jgi:glycosyltransferase involved in cell wall biosynthesis